MSKRTHDEFESGQDSNPRVRQRSHGYHWQNKTPGSNPGRPPHMSRVPTLPLITSQLGSELSEDARNLQIPKHSSPSTFHSTLPSSRSISRPAVPRHDHEAQMSIYRARSPQSSHELRRGPFSDARAPSTEDSYTPIRNQTLATGHPAVPVLILPGGATPALARRVVPTIESTGKVGNSKQSSSTGVTASGHYQYLPLQPNEIRLIVLHPARSSSIRCDILSVPLHEAPPYTAISYAWGDDGDQRNIELSGITISVTISLYGALGALRESGDKNVWIWADALCIDQNNRAEKSQQLPLMTVIYGRAHSVAIWLGPEKDDSKLATELLEEVVLETGDPNKIKSILAAPNRRQHVRAVVSLFERDYWDRLWVAQEIFNANLIWVYCGATRIPWSIYRRASLIFWDYKSDIQANYPSGRDTGHQGILYKQLSYSQVLAYEGPANILDRPSLEEQNKLQGEPIDVLFKTLLAVMRGYRRKLSGEPRDKVFGLLGVLPEKVRDEISVDYDLPVRDVYINVVDTLLYTTKRLDVICECIHFPRHTNSFNLPSWVPDWSYMPDVNSLGASYRFSADGEQKQAVWEFKGERRSKLQIAAIHLGVIEAPGIAVGTLCKLADYLMAFLHWRALLLGSLRMRKADATIRALALEIFCLTLSLGIKPAKDMRDWMELCHHVFASTIKLILPELALDRDLAKYISSKTNLGDGKDRRQFLYEHFGSRMIGRCFFLTDEKLMGMGSGFMTHGDIIVVPFGCSTPIILRPEGNEFRFIGDAYIYSYMDGKAIEDHALGKRKLGHYVLH